MITALDKILAHGNAGDGYTFVVYMHKFEALVCDHHIKGTIAIDMYDTHGNLVDGMTCCEKCVDAGIKLWAVPATDCTCPQKFLTFPKSLGKDMHTAQCAVTVENNAHIIDNDNAERELLAGESDDVTRIPRAIGPRFSYRKRVAEQAKNVAGPIPFSHPE